MKPHQNGDDDLYSSSSSESEESRCGSREVAYDEMRDPSWGQFLVDALQGARSSRSHCDVRLVGEEGGEVAAHRAVLYASCPRLRAQLAEGGSRVRVRAAQSGPVRSLVHFIYSGELRVRDNNHARALYKAAYAMGVDRARLLLAERVVRDALDDAPDRRCCIDAMELQDLPEHLAKRLYRYIDTQFESLLSEGALSGLRCVVVEGDNPPWASDSSAAHVVVATSGAMALAVADGAPQLFRLTSPSDSPERLGDLLSWGRCAHGAAVLDGRLVVAGGFDRAHALKDAESWVSGGGWVAAPAMRSARARFASVVLGDALWAVGGSDGSSELCSVERLSSCIGAKWESRLPLPSAREYSSAASVPEEGLLFVVGGCAGGQALKDVLIYSEREDKWTQGPSLNQERSQCSSAWWGGYVWAVGGCGAWRCLATVERMEVGGGGWEGARALAVARRAAAAIAWRNSLVLVGGCDGSRSLSRSDVLSSPSGEWMVGPSMVKSRAHLSLTAFADSLFAVGGYSGREFLRCAETLTDLDSQWTLFTERDALSLPLIEKKETKIEWSKGNVADNEVKENGLCVNDNKIEETLNTKLEQNLSIGQH